MGNKLLLADDSITIQKVVGIIFANEDYQLTIVDNGNDAIDKASEMVPDVMLVDAIMPGKTGYEVCETIRRDPQLKGTPILLMTGAFEPFDEGQARASGADDFITKPFESQHLIEKVKNLLVLGKERPQAAAAPEVAASFPVEDFSAASADPWGEAASSEVATAFAPTAPAVEDMDDGFTFMEESSDESAFATEMVSPEEVQPASSADDLWGAFEIEEVPESEEGDVEAVVEVGDSAPAPVDAEAFSFIEEDAATTPAPEEFSFEEAPATHAPEEFSFEEAPETEARWETVEEDVFSFEEPAGEPVESFVSTEASTENIQPPPSSFAPSEPPFSIEQEPAAPPVQPTEPVAAVAATPAANGTMTISEEQLASMVAKISRDIIERIAWEVVPDLAESLIKEEIRKIKEGQ